MEILNISSREQETNLLIIERAINWLKQGKVLVCPTDTVYGLIADAGNRQAVGRIFKIKKRNVARPLPFFVSGIEQAKKVANISERQEEFLKKVWPGRFTVILEKRPGSEKLIIQDGDTVALRSPDYPLISAILEKSGLILAETSANLSDQPPCWKIGDISRQFQGQTEQPDIVLDAGTLPENKPSMIIDLTRPAIKTLRK